MVKKKPIRTKVSMPFSANLRDLIERNKLSLRSVAEIAGVNPAVVHNWIHGQSVPHNLLAVQKLCHHFGCDFEFMLTGYRQVKLAQHWEPLPDNLEVLQEEGLSGIFLLELKRLRKK